MNKQEIYSTYAKLPKDDGTFQEYFEVYMNHPQHDESILKRACKEFSEYVGFCMNITVKYKTNKDNYRRRNTKEEEIDKEDYKINLWPLDIDIYPDTDLSKIPYPNIEGLVKMILLQESYSDTFTRLLNGEAFLNN